MHFSGSQDYSNNRWEISGQGSVRIIPNKSRIYIPPAGRHLSLRLPILYFIETSGNLFDAAGSSFSCRLQSNVAFGSKNIVQQRSPCLLMFCVDQPQVENVVRWMGYRPCRCKCRCDSLSEGFIYVCWMVNCTKKCRSCLMMDEKLIYLELMPFARHRASPLFVINIASLSTNHAHAHRGCATCRCKKLDVKSTY